VKAAKRLSLTAMNVIIKKIADKTALQISRLPVPAYFPRDIIQPSSASSFTTKQNFSYYDFIKTNSCGRCIKPFLLISGNIV
jgi:hypothetical protein